MLVEKLPPVKATLQPSNHPYLNGAWTPQHEEVTAFDLEVIEGKIPTDIDGIYLRNTENQLHQPLGRYHPFDGDGMIHQIDFSGGKASYRNRFVRTRCFQAEQDAGGSLWGGLMDGGTVEAPRLWRAWRFEGFFQHRHHRPRRKGCVDILPMR